MISSNDNSSPLVSILVPAMNEELHIQEAIGSVLAQSYSNIEVLFVDDFSTDKTYEIVSGIDDPRLKVYRNDVKGKVSGFNMAYQNSKGDFIVYFGADDVMPKDSIEHRVRTMIDGNPDAEVVAGYGQLITMSDDPSLDGVRRPRDPMKGHCSGGTLVIGRKLAEIVFPVPIELPNEDTWTRLCIEYLAEEVLDVPHLSLRYRIHPGNSHDRNMDFGKHNEFLWARGKAYEIFAQRQQDRLSSSQLNRLNTLSEIELLRYHGKSFRILTKFIAAPRASLRAFLLSSRLLRRIRSTVLPI